MILSSATMAAHKADVKESVQQYTLPEPPMHLMIGSSNNAYLGFNHVDLTNVGQIVFVAFAPVEYGFAGGTIEIHIDSPTGELLGTTNFVTPTKGAGAGPKPVIVASPLKSVSGFHDLYFVYKNDKTVGGQSLFIILQAQMIPAQPAATKGKISMR
jgi:cytochrome c